MRIDILTLFPEMFAGPLDCSIIGKAREKGCVNINIHNLRDFSSDERHRKVDDRPYGGGPGMVIKPEPIYKAIASIDSHSEGCIILMSPQGERFNQEKARKLIKRKHLILICGRYEGIDERVRENLVDEEISVGDYVVSGGELPAMIVVDAITRLLPGVVGREESVKKDSFSEGMLDYPTYTRPAIYRGMEIPSVLLSGNHLRIEKWRREEALRRTILRRPDIIKKDRK
ncbi:tRNA (guanosine(37)-N1)-methyltransferase TrmD [candidate division NPL-UPA2 bacterium Unc8]|uniref:tRNA (guanine-N(1)-)-methyltransferase n=1 Tax=candidate division NPL-UPA2 bacterium Unc8 TaxID=1980939 RepID=A0A399G025_UNCN2|nr:tRNA (guanine-N(1)-)-methyltransferase [Bacillota bacterium]MBT9139099.1 tRNA (guanine-N(1)-)-methyltransferase [Bacillota bacterium]MBT9148298.1 tRNA (guanine-N(1)-)-methyltransferase [Bacillota bacterium]RII01066.1 MAG: tRNA (guanosine(37)-N1)-methyltransferase TrmD [candidate division NPL-UPA2 bacterium Unc8]